MISLLSPAKTLDYNHNFLGDTLPEFHEDSIVINEVLRKKSAKSLQSLMKISEKLATENNQRNKSFSSTFDEANSRSAIHTFKGDVYRGIEVETLKKSELNFANKHVRILSGLYGILKPYDKIQAYRLEMGTGLKVKRKSNLYDYWGTKLSDHLIEELKSHKQKFIINLASKEYFKAVDYETIQDLIITMHFKEYRDGKLKFVSFNAKRARGLMTRYIVQNKIDTLKHLKGFNLEDYAFDESMSDEKNYYFIR